MMSEQVQEPVEWNGREIFDAKNRTIGTIAGLAFPRRRFGTTWLLIDTGGDEKLPVPLIEIRSLGDRLVLPYPASYIRTAPMLVGGKRLSKAELRRLGLHYGFEAEGPGASCCQGCGLCKILKQPTRT